MAQLMYLHVSVLTQVVVSPLVQSYACGAVVLYYILLEGGMRVGVGRLYLVLDLNKIRCRFPDNLKSHKHYNS